MASDANTELTKIYAGRLSALVHSARYRALQVGGSAVYQLEHSIDIHTMRAYVEALCRLKGMPEYKARTKHQLAEFTLRVSATGDGVEGE